MQSFIDQVVEVINNSSLPEYDLCIIVPNRRAGLFLKQKLIPLGKPRWLPAILTIEDFVFSTSKLTEADNITMLAYLYKAHCESSTNRMPFDTFLSWGSEILRDFEEVDQYLIKTDKLFEYVSNAREMDIWIPGDEMTSFELNYLEFYKSLSTLYHAFTKLLLSKNQAYQGQATRLIATKPDKYLRMLRWKRVLFAGFNALTPSQTEIIKYLKSSGTGELIVDADSFYLDDPVMEAGHFLRKLNNDRNFSPLKHISNDFIRPDRKIYTCGVPGITAQAKVAGSLIAHIPVDEYSETAIVLADESLLLPVLNALPLASGSFNVTMGFPIVQTPLFSLADALMKMYVNAIDGKMLYHADVVAVLQNSRINCIIPAKERNRLISVIKKDNYSYLSPSEIKKLADDTYSLQIGILFTEYTGPLMMISILIKLLEEIKNCSDNTEDPSSEEVLYTLWKNCVQLKECLCIEGIEIESATTLYSFFREMAINLKVPFYGEPLKGIQVMGMLETRMLDFKNVILLSVNEDILPSSKSNRSFIPFDIRVHYGLPTHTERQAVFAYHFYRLLQRNSNTWLVYNQISDVLGGGEKSRYIRQLEWELPRKGISITQLNTDEIIKASTGNNISVIKDTVVMQKLTDKAQKGFSYSSILKYIDCQLAFYYSYILKLEESDEVEEDISTKTMGIILHEVLQDIYSNFLGSHPDPGHLQEAVKNAASLIVNKTTEYFPALKIDSGHNLLFIKVAEIWLIRFLKSELQKATTGNIPVIIGVEKSVKRPVTIQSEGRELEVTLYGKIDRIDLLEGTLRVIDYKTGKVDTKNTKLTDVADLFNSEKETSKQLQLSFYKYLADGQPENTNYQIVPGIITFRSLNKGFIPLEGDFSLGDFESHLKDLLEEIFNKEITFKQTGTKHCRYCNYADICRKSD